MKIGTVSADTSTAFVASIFTDETHAGALGILVAEAGEDHPVYAEYGEDGIEALTIRFGPEN